MMNVSDIRLAAPIL